MATILVDYENVVGSNGLKGVDALQNDDVFIIFTAVVVNFEL